MPTFDSTFIERQYGFRIHDYKSLDGYESINFRLKTDKGTFVLKQYQNNADVREWVEAENDVLLFLSENFLGVCSFPIPSLTGNFLPENEAEGTFYRLLNFLEGTFLGDAEHTPELFFSFGEFLGGMNKVLFQYKNPIISNRRYHWDNQFYTLNKKHISYIPDASKQALVEYFILQYEEQVVPMFSELRMSIIHGDANDWNVLTSGEKTTGIIDFGDMCHSHIVNELAIGICYVIMNKDNPTEAALPIIQGYHSVFPLEEKELEALYLSIAIRLCISVINSAYSARLQPDKSYITVSEKGAWDLLEKWVAINPIHAPRSFKKCVGFPVRENISAREILQKRHVHISKSLSVSYNEPIHMSRAAFQYMYDEIGNTYLDAYNNIPLVGHSHPAVVEAARKQMAKLNTNTRYLYDELHIYAEQLLGKFPAPLNKVFFVNSGSAASDLALRLAFAYSNNKGVMVLEHGYHGNTRLGIDISHYKYARKGGQGKENHILELPVPDAYKGPLTLGDGADGERYAADAIRRMKSSGANYAAFISEAVMGCAGQVPLAPGYLEPVFKAVREQGGVCICDEVQIGFGRMGSHFWGFELQGVVPDIVVLGKPMGNGHPIGAVVTTDEVADAFDNGMEFFSSFGGNPVSCAIGSAVLNTIEKEGLQQKSKEVGDYFLEQMRGLQNQYECIGDVRGHGLFVGMELVKDRVSKVPDTALAKRIKNELRRRHILISTDGPFGNIIKSKPPLCFNCGDVDVVICAMSEVLKTMGV